MLIGPHILAWSPFDPWHLLVIGMVALLLFGKRLPEVGRSLGRGISEFKKGLRDVQDELSKEDEEPPKPKLRAPDSSDASTKRRPEVEGGEPSASTPPRRRPEGEQPEVDVGEPPAPIEDRPDHQ